MKYSVGLACLVLLSSSVSAAQIPTITPAGRWEVLTITGDQPAQSATGTPVIFDTTMTCVNEVCGAVEIYNRDTSVCDEVHSLNMTAGLAFNPAWTLFGFAVAGQYGGKGAFFVYTFSGQITETWTINAGVPSLTSATVTGGYGSTPGGCNNGISENQGLFVARWYPPLNGSLIGEVVPSEKTGTSVGMQLSLTQVTIGNLIGRIQTGILASDPRTGEPIIEPAKSPCFSSDTLEIVGTGDYPSAAIGHTFQIYAVDSVGNSLTLKGTAMKPASNDLYSVGYEIVGGACNGQTGTNATFRMPSPTPRIIPPKSHAQIR